MKKLLFIYNPNAGKGIIQTKLSKMIDIFVKAGYEVTVYPTQCRQDAYEKVLHADDSYDLVVCSGGDGTLDEVVTGMMNRESKIPVGYVPTGTTNDFANSLNLPKELLHAAETAVKGEVFSCDVGSFNEDYFVYIAGFGLFTDVSYQTKQEMKNVLGHLAYLLEGVKRLPNIPSYRVKFTHDGEEIEDELIYGMVTNSRSIGGFRNMIGKNVIFDDGLFEVTLIRKPANIIALQEIIGALLRQEFDTKYMYSFKTGKITFESDVEIPWTLDGEFGGDHKNVEIQNKKQSLQIMVQSKTKDKE